MRDSNKLGSKIHWVCIDCGKEALTFNMNLGKKQYLCSTIHNGKCDVCGKVKPVTEARDFQYPKFK